MYGRRPFVLPLPAMRDTHDKSLGCSDTDAANIGGVKCAAKEALLRELRIP